MNESKPSWNWNLKLKPERVNRGIVFDWLIKGGCLSSSWFSCISQNKLASQEWSNLKVPQFFRFYYCDIVLYSIWIMLAGFCCLVVDWLLTVTGTEVFSFSGLFLISKNSCWLDINKFVFLKYYLGHFGVIFTLDLYLDLTVLKWWLAHLILWEADWCHCLLLCIICFSFVFKHPVYQFYYTWIQIWF